MPKAQAQLSSLRKKQVVIFGDTTTLDTLSIQAGTFKVLNKSNFNERYILVAEKAWIIRKNSSKEPDTLDVEYRVFPFLFSKVYSNPNRRISTAAERGIGNPFLYTPQSRDKSQASFSGLNKSGSLSRGISVGNNQDLAVNSALNLQLSGKLSPEIDISAAITDENIPIQPDGNTQQLQDFDKVFIQLSDERSKLIVGDFQITRPESYFMNFNKRLQGGSFTTRQEVKPFKNKAPLKLKSGASIAVARGRFARNSIQGIEGNQGPYRLKGIQNEQYIVVLSGSEKVYIDGRLLKRGQENDYIIDYNNAEISFTAKVLMTKDLRIFVEFEYTDRNYARSLVYFNQEVATERVQLKINYYLEQDSKNQPLQQQLSNEQKQALTQAGDSLSQALVPSADSVAFSPDAILYKQIDTTVAGVVYQNVLVYSTHPDSAHYRAIFTQVGINKGDYIQTSSAANGRVYLWVAPVNGIPQGTHVAKYQLVPPGKKQLTTLGVDVKLTEGLSFQTELAHSVNDKNTFSALDNEDDMGWAGRTALNYVRNIGKDSLPWQMASSLSLEYVNRNFSPQERFRNVEFDRDWNSGFLSLSAQNEILPRFNIAFSKQNLGQISYLLTAYQKENTFNAQQHGLNATIQKKGWNINYLGSITQNKAEILDARFYRHKSLVSKEIWKVQLGYKDELEQNLLQNDSLDKSSYAFFDRQVFIQNRDTARQKFNVFYRQRSDDGVLNSRLKNYALAESFGVSTDWSKSESLQIRALTAVRNLYIRDTTLSSQAPERSLLNRLEVNVKGLKGSVVSSLFYEAGSGLESRKEFSYLEVQPGQGIYSWNDYNNNGIKELNEFELAAFPDQARYIRVFIPTTDFIKVYSNQFSQSLMLKAPSKWQKEKGIKKLIARISAQSALKIDGRSQTEDEVKAFNPFTYGIEDPDLISFNQALRNSLFFNRSQGKVGLEFNWQQNSNKALLNNGLESRSNRFANHRLRWNAGDRFTLNTEWRNGQKTSKADFFSTRDFSIQYFEVFPAITYQPNVKFRLNLNYKYGSKKNTMAPNGENALSQSAGVDVKYSEAEKGSFTGRLNFILIKYNGQTNTPVAFEIMEGLSNGQNYTWGISYQRTLSNNMQININYDGRKSGTAKTVHVGGVQVRLFF